MTIGAVIGMPAQLQAQECEGGFIDAGITTSFACGENANVLGGSSVAVGNVASTVGVEGTAVGQRAYSGGSQSTAYGAHSSAGGTSENYLDDIFNTGATAIGMGASAGSVALGQNEATALGHNAAADALNATALGAGSTANFTNSTAIGQGAATSRDNQVAVGTAASTYTLGGVNSQASKDAQSGDTYLMTTDAAGNLAASTFDMATLEDLPETVAQHGTQISTLQTTVGQHTTSIADHETRISDNTETLLLHTGQIAGLDNRVTVNETNIGLLDGRVTALENGFDDLSGEISDNRTEARQGIAAAIAMATAPMPSAPGRTTWASNLGFFKGETAVGGSLTHRFDTDIPIGLTAGYSYGGGDSHAGRFGLMGEF
jgi:hypothetical protein